MGDETETKQTEKNTHTFWCEVEGSFKHEISTIPVLPSKTSPWTDFEEPFYALSGEATATIRLLTAQAEDQMEIKGTSFMCTFF